MAVGNHRVLEVTEVEVKAVGHDCGRKEVHVVQARGGVGARMHPVGNMIVDIGSGKTEVAVISLHGVVAWKSSTAAGDEMNRNIMQYAREVFNLFVGESHAEQIKIKIGSALDLGERLEFPMRGRDVVTGLPKEIMIGSDHVREALARTIHTITDLIKLTLEVTPPELTADIHERGLLLTGGGSQFLGIDRVIAAATEVPVRIADDPLSAVVRGAGLLLDDQALLREVVMPSARDTKKKFGRERRRRLWHSCMFAGGENIRIHAARVRARTIG